MKRPLSVFGFTMLGSLFFLCTVDSALLTVSVCGFFALLGCILAILRKKHKSTLPFVICLAVAFSCAFLMCFQGIIYYPALKEVGENRQISAEVLQPPTRDNKRYHVMAKTKLNSTSKTVKIRLSFPVTTKYDDELQDIIESLEVGDTVTFLGDVYKLGETNIDIEQNFKSKNVFIGSYPKGKVILQKAERKNLSYFIISSRQKIINTFFKYFDNRTASIGVALLFGEKSYMDDSTYNSFKKAGVTHIMAVSGLHLSVWISFATAICTQFKLNKRKMSFGLIGFVILVMCMTLFSASITRAGIMMILYLLGFSTRNKADSLNSLGLASILILLNNPYSSLNVGFLLSFLSTLAIVTLAPNYLSLIESLLEKRISDKFVKSIISSILFCCLLSFITTLFTMPVIATYFRSVSLVSVFTNICMLPIVSPLLISFGLFAVFNKIPLVSLILKTAVNFLTYLSIIVTEFFSSLKGSTVTIEKGVLPIICSLCILSAAILILFSRKKNVFLSVASLLLSFLILGNCVLYNEYYKTQNVIITAFDVSDGMCVCVKDKGKNNLIYAETDEYYTNFLKDDIEKIENAVVNNPENENVRLVSKLNPEKIFIKLNENLLPIDLQKKICKEKEILLRNCKIKIDGSVIYLQVYDIIIAVTNESVENADVIITKNENLKALNNNQIIILSSDKTVCNSYSTAEYSDITVTVSKNGKIKIRGENTWRSLTKSN